MTSYGTSFGFRHSGADQRSVAEGQYKTPAGSALLLGTMVEINPAVAGDLKQSAANAVLVPGYSGLLLQELDFIRSIYETDAAFVDTYMLGVARPAQLAVITSGTGTKVWFKNRSAITRLDGRVVAAVTIFDPTGLAAGGGDDLGWDGTKWVKTNGTTVTNVVFRTTSYNATTGLVEAYLQK